MPNKQVAYLAGGCFWCTEAVFKRLKGVTLVNPGYMGGTMENPTTEDIYNKNTGHAETVMIVFDPNVISFENLLEVFWKLHDPTTLNQQGVDIGTQYRSAIFYTTPQQKETAEKSKQQAQHLFSDSIVTEITPASEFYKAEKYHENFYESNRRPDYCRIVIDPKIQKLYKEFPSIAKPA